MDSKYFSIVFVVIAFLLGCARGPIKDVTQAMRTSSVPDVIVDDLLYHNLSDALRTNIERLKTFGAPLGYMRFGSVEISRADYIAALESLLQAHEQDPTGQTFREKLKKDFEFHEVYGDTEWGKVFITSYYEPVIQGRLKKKKPYTQPLYGYPQDIVLVNTAEFSRISPALEAYQETVVEQKSRDGILRGRIVKDGHKSKIVPYYSRQEIDELQVVNKASAVLCYVDPIDAFFLQIQGSGTVVVQETKKEIRVGYAEQNGHPYRAIGRVLFDKIPKEQMTAQKIEQHLRSLPQEEAQKIMNQNPSYIFFQKMEGSPQAYFGTAAVPGRTIATDTKYFPKGALAYLEYEQPVFPEPAPGVAPDAVQEWKKSARFVLDQDTGGAIRGPHRVDLFWGRGPEAARYSGVMRNPGRLYYILPKNRAL
jgi:membrane-bound lytic murein transglycosylase A